MSPGAHSLVLASLLVGGLGLRAAGDADRHFLEKVQPLLQARCLTCHGPDDAKGGLRLDSRAAALQGGELGPALLPGKPDDSPLLQAVNHALPERSMPPKDPLSAAEIEHLRRWIADGAPWPEEPVAATEIAPPGERLGDAWTDPRNPITRIFQGQRLDLWSMRPLQDRPLPPPEPGAGTAARGVDHPLDRWIGVRLKEAGLKPSPPADARSLARRVAFDLTGLPPRPEELERHLADRSPGAYERWVDRLLASPAYGEHVARWWLDVVRYSDSNGFDWDEFRPEAWRFRDYVVRSFNADKPFDEFIREQLAGDELIPGPPRTAEEQDRLIATGYLRIGPQDNSASLFNEQDRARAEWLADLTETTGAAFLGLTMSCCRCHDHKFDPLSQADHFRLRAFFQPIRHGDDLALNLAPEQEEIRRQHAEVDRELAPFQKERETLLEGARTRVRDQRRSALTADEQRLLAASTPAPGSDADRRAALEEKLKVSDDDARRAWTEEEKKRDGELGGTLAALQKKKRPFTRGLLATDGTGDVPATRILFQGDHRSERGAVVPGFPSMLDPNPAEVPPPLNPQTTGRRLALANWIASPGNPLTARVFVNRVWQSLFGRGLVATANDFGLAGARPTHPELLDWLAGDFIRNQWSVKSLHRRIVTSAAYRQTASPPPHDGPGPDPRQVDAANTLLWRQNLRRLTAEQLRDTTLLAAGTLQRTGGGPSIWPVLPADILQANPAFLDDNAEKTKGWYPSPPDRQTVRTLYLVQKRTVRVPLLEAFDLPDNSVSCPQRTVSIVAPQALTLMNGPEAVAAARAFAERVAEEGGADPSRQVATAFQLAFQRAPMPEEAADARRLLQRRSLVELCRVLLNANEFAYVD